MVKMEMIDLYAKNPYSHDIGKKVMGTNDRYHRFICRTIIDRYRKPPPLGSGSSHKKLWRK